MDNDRNLGVTEARFGLTLLICLLVAIGYVLLLRLGSPGESAIEVGTAIEPQRSAPRGDEGNDQPRVLKVESEEMAMRTSPRSGLKSGLNNYCVALSKPLEYESHIFTVLH